MHTSIFSLLLLALTTILSLLPTVNAQLRWRRINTTSTLPAGRRDHALAYDSRRNRLILFGGRNSERLSDTWEFDFATNTWTQLSPRISPEKRFSLVYGISGEFMYISTGQDVGDILYDDIWRLNLTSDQWEKIPTKGPKPGTVYGAAGGFYSNTSRLFYLTHGFSSSKRYASTFAFDTLADTWKEVFDDKSSYIFGHPNARCLHAGTMVDEQQLAMYGGCLTGGQTGGPCPAYDSWLFDGQGEGSWQQLKYCASPRLYASLALLPVVNGKKRAVLYGGSESHKTVLQHDIAEPDQVAVLNVNEKTWTLKRTEEAEIPEKRAGAAMIQHPKGIIMFGGSGKNDLWLLEGDAEDADKTKDHSQTCKKPFSGILNLIMLHGVFMVIGWGILLQIGAFIARYFRKHDPMWFHLHRVCQVSGLLFAIGGFVCAVMSVGFDHFKFGHGALGLVITILGILQPINAVVRPHKVNGEPVALKRKIWEFVHLNSGRVALICALVEIPLGFLQAQAFLRHHIVYYVYFGVMFVVYVVMEIRLQIRKSQTAVSSFEMR